MNTQASGQAAALALDEKWLVEHGYTQKTEYLWTRRGWPLVTRAVDGQWGHVPTRGEIIYRPTARELVQEVLRTRYHSACRAYNKAQARWDEALQ